MSSPAAATTTTRTSTSKAATTTSTFPRSSSSEPPVAPATGRRFLLDGGRHAFARFSTAGHGDLDPRHVEPVTLDARRRALVDGPWVALEQAHGAEVHLVRAPGDVEETSMRVGDALVTDQDGVVLSVTTADCAPVALVAPSGVIAAVHAGWRGLANGVIEATSEAMRSLGAVSLAAWLGPCIYPECYEFGPDELDRLVRRYGPGVRGITADGAPALDLPTTVAAALGRAGVVLDGAADVCTSCGPDLFSHRARGDTRRHALAVWLEGP